MQVPLPVWIPTVLPSERHVVLETVTVWTGKQWQMTTMSSPRAGDVTAAVVSVTSGGAAVVEAAVRVLSDASQHAPILTQ